MTGAAIPGYYFDEVKQKYFKIQADHLVPRGAKYSKSNVHSENRKTKKRKLEERKQAVLHQHTVKRNPVLRNAVTGGIGLTREHGNCSPLEYFGQSDAAFVSQLRSKRVKITITNSTEGGWWPITYAKYFPTTKNMATVAAEPCHKCDMLLLSDWSWDWHCVALSCTATGSIAVRPDITSLSAATQNDCPMTVMTSTDWNGRSELVMCRVFDEVNHPVIFQRKDELLASSINQTTQITAVLSDSDVFVVDAAANFVNSLSTAEDREYGPSIDWLSTNTVAYCCSTLGIDRKVLLWDTRTKDGTSARFTLRSRITGVVNPSPADCSSNNQLLISTNRRINLFDTRMPHSINKKDNPLLSFPHIHQGPQLQFTTNGRGLVAAVDRDNVIQVYSMGSGHHIGSLPKPEYKMSPGENPMVTQLQWYDDDRDGSALQACHGNGIVRWAWGGSADEDG